MSRILIVDDDHDGAEPVARFLRGCGHDVRYAPDGHEAIALVSDARPDLVLLDLLMPKMDGVSFLKVLRSYLAWQHLPVVVLTAYPDGPEARRAASLNASRVVCKGSVDLPDLGAIVAEQLHHGNADHAPLDAGRARHG